MTTQVGITTDRLQYIATSAARLQTLCSSPISTDPDIFGEVETVAGRNIAINRAIEVIARAAAMSDHDWDSKMSETAAQVRESDHPKHSVI